MEILLIGDYSMVHKNLKDGLEQLGHTVVLASDGDYWKKLPGFDLPMTPKLGIKVNFHTRIGRAVYNRLSIFLLEPWYVMWSYFRLCHKHKFDVIHIMSADLFDYRYRKRIYRFLLSLSHNNLYVAIPGEDCYIFEAWRKGVFKYFTFDDDQSAIRRFDESNRRSVIENEAYRYTIERAKALIPVNPYELEIPFQQCRNLRRAIPLPINVGSFKYSGNTVNDRIVIYHGISYALKKGSNYILDALEIIKSKYGIYVEIVTSEQISYEEFIEKLYKCHIYIDQCKSYSYGMSAVIAMAMGKVVMSGKEPEILPSLEGHDCPVINIIPDAIQIVSELEKLIADKDQLVDIGRRGRKFVEDLHECKLVANRYLAEWGR